MNWIILTGVSGKLGSEICKSLLASSKDGVIGLSRSKNSSVSEFQSIYPDRFRFIEFDLSKPENIKALFLEKLRRIGAISALINNAATAYDDLLTNADLDRIEEMFRVNVISPLMLAKYAIREMLLNEIQGSLIHISSISSRLGFKGLSMYASTKGAIESFSRSIAREWGEKGIRSNCISPGFMDTEMTSSLSPELKERIYKRSSIKGPTQFQSVSQAVLFLLMPETSSITGSVISVDNGMI